MTDVAEPGDVGPGRATFATKPSPTGSEEATKTIDRLGLPLQRGGCGSAPGQDHQLEVDELFANVRIRLASPAAQR